MCGMFCECSSLEELNFPNSNTNNYNNKTSYIFTNSIFSGCSNELKTKYKNLNNNIKKY